MEDEKFWELYFKSEFYRSDKGNGDKTIMGDDMFFKKDRELKNKRKIQDQEVSSIIWYSVLFIVLFLTTLLGLYVRFCSTQKLKKDGKYKRTKKLDRNEFDLTASLETERPISLMHAVNGEGNYGPNSKNR